MSFVSPAQSHLGSCIWEAYAGNDGVPIAVRHKVFDGPCCSCSQMVAADEVGSDIIFRCVRAWVPRTRLFGGVCMAIGQCAIGLGCPVDGQRGHAVGAAKVAERMDGRSVENGLECCRKNLKFHVNVLSGPARLRLRVLFSGEEYCVVGDDVNRKREKKRKSNTMYE